LSAFFLHITLIVYIIVIWQIAGIYYKDDLLVGPLEFVDGAVVVPSGAGMGIAVDEEKIAKYRLAN